MAKRPNREDTPGLDTRETRWKGPIAISSALGWIVSLYDLRTSIDLQQNRRLFGRNGGTLPCDAGAEA